VGGADNAAGYGEIHAQRITDGDDGLPRTKHAAVAKGGTRQPAGVNFDHRQISSGIGTHHFGREGALVVEGDLQLVGILDHVVVGHDVAVGGDDDAATQGGEGLWVGSVLEGSLEELAKGG